MRIYQVIRPFIGIVVVGSVIATAYFTQEYWIPLLQPESVAESEDDPETPIDEPKVLKLSPQARKNLKLVSKPVVPQSYWRVVQIPGTIVDRPGRSDRGVTSPAVGVISKVHAFPGDTVRPGDRLLTLRIFSEYLQSTQKELFTATNEIQIAKEELDRIRPLAESGGIPKSRLIDLQNTIRRKQAITQAHRQDLLTRGLNPTQIDRVAKGEFVSEIDIVAPPLSQQSDAVTTIQTASFQSQSTDDGIAFELQQLNAELGQQVQAGQLLVTLADHSSLYIEGHAFKREATHLATAAQNGWSIKVEFVEDDGTTWPELAQSFEIRHLSNSIDAKSRTFDFYIPFQNQARTYKREGETFIVWRFRPGQRARLYVPVEEMTDVVVLPAAAVVREGPEAFVFQQNGDLFDRLPVQVLHEDRLNIVIANDGSVTPGLFLAQNAAASLNRVMKAQAASGMRADVHVHADGTVHANH